MLVCQTIRVTLKCCYYFCMWHCYLHPNWIILGEVFHMIFLSEKDLESNEDIYEVFERRKMRHTLKCTIIYFKWLWIITPHTLVVQMDHMMCYNIHWTKSSHFGFEALKMLTEVALWCAEWKLQAMQSLSYLKLSQLLDNWLESVSSLQVELQWK